MSCFLDFLIKNNIKYKISTLKNGYPSYKISVEHEDLVRKFLFTINNDYKIEDRKDGVFFKVKVFE